MVNEVQLRRAVFLDRDGVLNRSVVSESGVGRAPWSMGEIEVDVSHRGAVRALEEAGWLLVIVTNQPDVSRGLLTESDALAINGVVEEAFPQISASYLCFHTGSDGCSCRKPLPGMLLRAAGEWGIDTASSWMVGDRWVDIAAGKAAGCRTILIEHGGSWLSTSSGEAPTDLVPDYVVGDLLEAAQVITEVMLGPSAQ